MSKRNIIIIIIAAAALFILLVVFLFLNSYISNRNKNITQPNQSASTGTNVNKNNTPTATTTNIVVSNQTVKQDKTAIKALLAKKIAAQPSLPEKNINDIYKSVDDCSGLKTDADKNVCVTLWAEYEKDPSICLKATAAEQQDCQDRAYIDKAIASNDVSLCANIKGPDGIRTCIFKVVDSAGLNEKDCGALSDNAESHLCLTEVLLSRATTVSDCDNILDPDIKQTCLNNYYANLPKQ
jgi:hypothetical protein